MSVCFWLFLSFYFLIAAFYLTLRDFLWSSLFIRVLIGILGPRVGALFGTIVGFDWDWPGPPCFFLWDSVWIFYGLMTFALDVIVCFDFVVLGISLGFLDVMGLDMLVYDDWYLSPWYFTVSHCLWTYVMMELVYNFDFLDYWCVIILWLTVIDGLRWMTYSQLG